MAEAFLVINKSDNLCINTVILESADEWLNTESFVLPQATTPALLWLWDKELKQYYQETIIGGGGIDMSWNGVAIVAPQHESPQQD